MKITAMLKKIYPFLILAIVSYIIWWSPDFWHPDTYFNIGDALFPFQPGEQMSSSFYAWQDNVNEGLGFNRTYAAGITLYYYALMALLKVLGIPLWICNRLFFLIPTLALLFTSYYMILSFIDGKHRHIGSILGSVFLTTALPFMFLDPLLHIGIAGMTLSFASLKRFIDKRKNCHLITFALGVLLMTSMPRYIYLSIIFMSFFLICWFVLNCRGKFKHTLLGLIRPLIIALVLIVLLNFYTLLPTVSFLFEHHSSELMPSKDIFLQRLTVIDFFKNTSAMPYSIRLINSNPYSIYVPYFSNYFNLLISFVVVIYLFIPLIRKKIRWEILCVLATSLFILCWAVIFGSDFYKFLVRVIPGFWIMNNPQYIVMPLALMYSILLAYSSIDLLQMIETSSLSKRKMKIISIFVVVGTSFLIIINNGIYFFDRIPGGRKVFITEETDNIALGNHLPYFKIPEEYQKIGSTLPDEDKNARVLILPFLSDGYMRFSWWPYRTMTEILAQITSLRLAGVSFAPSNKLRTIKKSILSKNYAVALNMLKRFDFKYIFIHKDMLPYTYFFDNELKVYLTQLSTVDGIETIMDNKYFRLYKLETFLDLNYSSGVPTIINGDTEVLRTGDGDEMF